ncbi:hypothetical protein ACFFX0_28060 [Citricoccus parietis]|uniref:Uncharacterized protein n=1 Tax=Citricoccus parietis TaxID=592307 RepID=A0ABV5G7D6_9MICC
MPRPPPSRCSPASSRSSRAHGGRESLHAFDRCGHPGRYRLRGHGPVLDRPECHHARAVLPGPVLRLARLHTAVPGRLHRPRRALLH